MAANSLLEFLLAVTGVVPEQRRAECVPIGVVSDTPRPLREQLWPEPSTVDVTSLRTRLILTSIFYSDLLVRIDTLGTAMLSLLG